MDTQELMYYEKAHGAQTYLPLDVVPGPTHLNFEAGWLGECFHRSSEERPLDAQMVSHEKSRMERQES